VSLTAAWLNAWALISPGINLPHIRTIPGNMAYLRTYFLEWAHMEPHRQAETHRTFKRQVYDTLRTISTAGNRPREVRIMQLQPAIDWFVVWVNLHNLSVFDDMSAWYIVVHGIIPTNMRLHRIRVVDTENCKQCGRQDTMLHRLTECGAGKEIWEWTHTQIARIQRTYPRRIPADWLVRTWRRKRHQAILWFWAHMVVYQVNQRRSLSVVDYIDFMRRTRWKTYQCSNRIKFVVNYLDVF
jgi:hypothetical protein